MGTFTANWEDEENNRIVELLVDYSLTGGRLAGATVTPTAVTFCDQVTREPKRTISVWTKQGRRMLLRQYCDSCGMDHLESQLESTLAVAAG